MKKNAAEQTYLHPVNFWKELWPFGTEFLLENSLETGYCSQALWALWDLEGDSSHSASDICAVPVCIWAPCPFVTGKETHLECAVQWNIHCRLTRRAVSEVPILSLLNPKGTYKHSREAHPKVLGEIPSPASKYFFLHSWKSIKLLQLFYIVRL